MYNTGTCATCSCSACTSTGITRQLHVRVNWLVSHLRQVLLLLRQRLALLPALVETEERRGAVDPLDQPRARAQRRHRVVTRVVQLPVASVQQSK